MNDFNINLIKQELKKKRICEVLNLCLFRFQEYE